MAEQLKGLDSRTLAILYELCKKGPLTKKEMQSAMRLKLTTLNRAMKALEERNLIVPLGEAESTGGRRAATYDAAHRGLYLIGVDLSRTYVKIVLTNLKLTVLKTDLFFLNEQYSAERTVGAVLSSIERMLRDEGLQRHQILGVGIGTVGPLDREQGTMLNPEGFPNPGWGIVPLKASIEGRLSVPCVVDNGANAAALAEYLFGIGKDKQSVAYIHCGVGIRSAVIKDGRIIRTMNDQEDAFGAMIVLPEAGRRGSIESFSALGAVIRAIAAELGLGVRELNEENYKEVLENLGETGAVQKIIRESAGVFGIGLSNFVRLLNPDMVILSGPLMMNLKGYYRECVDAFYRNYRSAGQILFSRGGFFQEDTIAVGSAAMMMEHCCKAGAV